MRIEEKMSKDDAELYIDEMAEKLEIDLLDFNVREKSSDEKKSSAFLLQGVMAGLIYYDEEKKCLAQKLTKTIRSGDFERNELYYKNKFKVRDARKLKEGGYDASVKMLSRVCDVPEAIINEMHGTNLEIAMACLDFFLK
ncbi:unknown [Fusobacterium sp. CAG:439]|nr:unknown [Fusobacterium sp. CAG:439]